MQRWNVLYNGPDEKYMIYHDKTHMVCYFFEEAK